jgi:outer membrane protein assembly factor BamB
MQFSHPAVVTLPLLLPVAALLQLLFPAVLRRHGREYRRAVAVLLAQATLLLGVWLSLDWLRLPRPAYLGDAAVWAAAAAAALAGLIASLVTPPGPGGRPTGLEFAAFTLLALGGAGCWAARLATGAGWLSQPAVLGLAAALGLVDLTVRRWRPAPARRTERVFLLALGAAGVAATGLILAWDRQPPVAPTLAIEGDWPTFRGSAARTGTLDPADRGPERPAVLWQFRPREPLGRVHLHSSPVPARLNDRAGTLCVILASFHQTESSEFGVVYRVTAGEAASPGGERIAPGTTLGPAGGWRRGTDCRPFFSTPAVAGGGVVLGEGYHQDRDCRLLGLDLSSPEELRWSLPTRSHVESSPTVDSGRVYCGAGDDGIFCVEPPRSPPREQGAAVNVVWHVEGVHIDSSPLVAGGRVVVGSTVGDRCRETCVLALDAVHGQELWRVPTPAAVPSSPALAGDRVLVTLGNGKANREAAEPGGAVWCLDVASGRRLWEVPLAGSGLATPAVAEGLAVAVGRSGECLGLDVADGRVRWRFAGAGPVVASPVVSGGRVFLVTTTGVVHCLDAGTGRPVWRCDELAVDGLDDVYASPLLVEGRLYVAAGGALTCLGDIAPSASAGRP